MRSGERSCEIEIWACGADTGEPNPPPEKLKTVFARLIPNRGARESFKDGERMSAVGYSARLDYLDGQGITTRMWVRFEGCAFNIVGVLVDHTTKKTIDLELTEQDRGA